MHTLNCRKKGKKTPSGRDRKVKMVIQPHDSFWGEEFYFLVTWLQLGECFPQRERERERERERGNGWTSELHVQWVLYRMKITISVEQGKEDSATRLSTAKFG